MNGEHFRLLLNGKEYECLPCRTLGLSKKGFCYDRSVIEFDKAWPPKKKNQYFEVMLFHKFISAN